VTLDEALYALLFKRSARDALARGDASRFGAAAPFVASLCLDELEESARAATTEILLRSQRGCGSIANAFARTIAAWKASTGSSLDALAEAFAESAPFDAWNALPTCSGGPCVEEAFFDFLESVGAGTPSTREAEYAVAVLRALLCEPAPTFRLPRLVLRRGEDYVVPLSNGRAFVATRGDKIVVGELSARRTIEGAPPLLH
jgi:hypothetical protein